MPKSISFYSEKFSGYALAILITALAFYLIDFSTVEINDLFFDKLVDFTGIFFGFLLTVLTLLLQTNNEHIKRLKKLNRFNDLIFFNKEVVIISAIVCVYALFILACKENLHLFNPVIQKKYGGLLLIFLLTVMISKTFTFLKIFYSIMKTTDGNSE